MNERVEAVVLAYEDAAVKPVVDSIPGFKHGAVAGKRTVDADKLQLGAQITWGCRIQAWHLASILLTLQERNNILTCRNLSIAVLKGGTDTDSIYGKMAVSVLTFGIVTS